MFEVFKYVDKFFTSLTNYLTYNYIFVIFVGLFLFTVLCVIFSTSKSYESKLIKSIDKFNAYFIDNPQINEDNLVAFNAKMKDKKVPKQLRKSWQQFVLYREDKASKYMSFENCVSNPIKNSSYTRDVKLMNVLAYIFAFCSLILNCYYCFETSDVASVLQKVLLAPVIILLVNYIIQIFLNLRHNAVVSDLFQNYQYFEVNIDKATETLPEYVDYEVLFDRNEIKRGIPILYAYLQKRAEEEQRELERARLKNVEHEKFNFDDTGVAASLVLERAMQEAENYIAERKKYNQDIQQINEDMTQEDINYREITKEYNRQMQVSKETFANFKSQLEEASSSIEANYLKKQQQQELDRQRNLERDFDTATERHKKVVEGFQAELDTVDKFIAKSRQGLENAMKSEFSTYSSKVYDEANKLVEEREKEKYKKLKANIQELEEKLVAKNEELDKIYKQNQLMNEKLESFGVSSAAVKPEQSYQPEEVDQYQEESFETTVEEPAQYLPEQQESYEDQTPYEEYYDDQTLNEDTDYDENYDYEGDENFDENAEYVDDESYGEDEYTDEEFGDNQYADYEEDYAVNEQEDNPYGEEDNSNSEDESDDENAGDDSTGGYSIFDDTTEYDLADEDSQEEDDADIDNIINSDFIQSAEDRVVEDEDLENTEISTDKEDDSIQNKVVSKRGRPRKVVDTQQIQGEKKQRGRPRKIEEPIKTEEKRGRGRPRKEETKVSTEVKKGPGRPKKIQVEEKVDSTPKKGRGRPRKEETKASAQVKKGPGRPKKQEVKTSTEVKKGPGRPKKVENTPVKEEKKQRGRPRKIEEAPKSQATRGRGRPKKQEVQAPVEVKRGRGRPKKIDSDVPSDISDIDAYLKEIDNAIAQENQKLQESQKELAKNAKLRRKK